MVQIPGFLILLCKKKPPTKAVVIWGSVALAGFIKRSQFDLNQRL